MESFDLAGPLPTGTTLLEASAGTGKTFTVAALVARYVAEEGVPLDQLLVITFGRAASQELRERVREQLVRAERALADPASADRDHPVVARLLDADDAEVGLRRHRRCATRSRRSTPPRSRPPTSSARRCSARSGSRATPTPARRWWSRSTSSSSRWSTTSTSAGSGSSPTTRRSAGRPP